METPPGNRTHFESYVEMVAEAVGHADRRPPLEAYLTVLLLAGERKKVERMAAKIDPRHVSRLHQSMHHFSATSPRETISSSSSVSLAPGTVAPLGSSHRLRFPEGVATMG